MEKLAIVTAKEMWQEFNKMKDALKDEIMYELKDRNNQELYTRKELAKYLKVTEQTIINWSSRGIITPIFIEGSVRYKGDEIRIIIKTIVMAKKSSTSGNWRRHYHNDYKTGRLSYETKMVQWAHIMMLG